MHRILRTALAVAIIFGLYIWYLNYRTETIGIVKKNMTIGDQTRFYYLSSNAEKLKNTNAPLIIFLHGMDKGLSDKIYTKPQYDFIDARARKTGFIGVFPRGTLGACDWDNNKYIDFFCWETKDDRDRAFIQVLTDNLEKEYGTNHQKTFLIGFANGGYFVVSYMMRHHLGRFAGYGIHSAGGYMFKNDPIQFYEKKFLISLNIGNEDPYHQETMQNIYHTLQKLNWPTRLLRYNRFEGIFELDKTSFRQEIDFFLQN